MHKTKLTLAQIALFGMMGPLTFGAKVAMSGLPNIEPVSLMVMVLAVTLGRKALFPIFAPSHDAASCPEATVLDASGAKMFSLPVSGAEISGALYSSSSDCIR